MNDEESLKLAIDAEIEIVPYNVLWPELFQQERLRLSRLFPDTFLGIEHIGSTAVPNLSAKPIIDIIAAVPSMEIADRLLPRLCQNGYTTSAEFNATLGDRRWLMRHAEGRRTHHLHLILFSGEDWSSKLRFRDILRERPLVAKEYVKLKEQFVLRLGTDREAYTNAKTEFITKILSSPVQAQEQ